VLIDLFGLDCGKKETRVIKLTSKGQNVRNIRLLGQNIPKQAKELQIMKFMQIT